MTRKHFIIAAKIIHDIPRTTERATTAMRFATLFHQINKRFDRKRFFEACNVKA